MGTDDIDDTVHYKEFINVKVGDAEVQTKDSEKYATYSVTVKTNSLSFTAPHTCVHRRYNEFLWLQRCLKSIPKLTTSCGVPRLPRKQFPFWNFDEDFLRRRKESLQEFLTRVTEETLFLSSSAFHLFIQTELSVPEMEEVISKGHGDKAITEHVKSVEVDNDFLNLLKADSHDACDSERNDSATRQPHATSKGHSPVYWRCRQNTVEKVTSLPHFNAVLKQYDGCFNNNTDSVDASVSCRQ